MPLGSQRQGNSIVVIPDPNLSEEEVDSGDEVLNTGVGLDDEATSEEESNSSDSDSGSSESNGAPGPSSRFHRGRQQKEQRNFRWRNREMEIPTTFLGNFFSPPDDVGSPYSYFAEFFTDDLIEQIAEETNRYSVQKEGGLSINVTKQEIEQFLGIILKMAICSMPSQRMYWDRNRMYEPICKVMSEPRFEEIRRYFHCVNNENAPAPNDPSGDRLFKVRPFLESIREQCLRVENEEQQSIDEHIIPFKGRSSLKQYLPKKPHKWGFKVYSRNGISGFTYDFLVYSGKVQLPKGALSLGHGGDVVWQLCKFLPKYKNYKLYFDNYFTSLELIIRLKSVGILSVGTIRADRTKGCPLPSDKEMQKKVRGTADFRVDFNSGVSVVKWMDSNVVKLASSYACVEPTGKNRRYDRKKKEPIQVDLPYIVAEYNTNMGGVVMFDMLMSLYRFDHRNKRYYMRIVYWGLQLCLINAWILYKRDHMMLYGADQKCLPLLDFLKAVATTLTDFQKPKSRPRGRPSLGAGESPDPGPSRKRAAPRPTPQSDLRCDHFEHLPEIATSKQRCAFCEEQIKKYKDGILRTVIPPKVSRTTVKCMKCRVRLCLTSQKNCFYRYHHP